MLHNNNIYFRRPCSDFMDMLRRLISRRIIIIIIIISPKGRIPEGQKPIQADNHTN